VLVERRTKDLPTPVLWIIAPTRALFETNLIRKRLEIPLWSLICLILNLIFMFTLPALRNRAFLWPELYLPVWLLPYSRIVEIGYAFYNDSFDQLGGCMPRSGMSRTLRLKMLGLSYFEVAVCYASMYLVLPSCSFEHPPSTGFESLYFSWITITTTGFGDIHPVGGVARFLCMTEIGVGLMLIVFGVGAYFSYKEAGH
jgi:hypothetical protein